MADALNVKKISAFTADSAPKDTDCFLTATGNVAKKTTVAQVKDMFGVITDERITETAVSNVSLANNSSGVVNGTTITLDEGYYVITAQIDFPANATGKRQVAIRNTTGNYGRSPLVVPAVSAGGMNLSTVCIEKVTTESKFAVFSFQNSGAAMTLTGVKIRAIKIANL